MRRRAAGARHGCWISVMGGLHQALVCEPWRIYGTTGGANVLGLYFPDVVDDDAVRLSAGAGVKVQRMHQRAGHRTPDGGQPAACAWSSGEAARSFGDPAVLQHGTRAARARDSALQLFDARVTP
jgi:hypothetical protein